MRKCLGGENRERGIEYLQLPLGGTRIILELLRKLDVVLRNFGESFGEGFGTHPLMEKLKLEPRPWKRERAKRERRSR